MAILYRKADKVDEAKALYLKLKKADDAYYNSDKPSMTDAAYDALRDKAKKVAKKTGDERLTKYLKRVGAPVRESKRSVELPFQMGSLKKVKSDSDKNLMRFIADGQAATVEYGKALAKKKIKQSKFYLRGAVSVTTSPKLDGLTFLLHYRNGILHDAFTRGDGKKAQSKIGHARTLVAAGKLPEILPKKAFHKFAEADLYVKCEVVCKLKPFKAKWQGKGYTNARSAAAGWLNSDTPSHSIHTAMDAIAYDVYTKTGELGVDLEPTHLPEGATADKLHTLTCLKNAGFKTYLKSGFFSHATMIGAPSATWIEGIKEMLTKLNSAPYQLDGLVIEVSNNHVRKIMGSKDGRPRFAIAYKTSADDLENNEGADSVVTEIEYNTSKSGALKPKIKYNPVQVMDSTLSQATGNNVSYLLKTGIGVGSKVRVVKAGGIIPKVHLVGPKAKADKILPKKCECGAPAIEVKKDGKPMPDWYCSNPSKCQIIQRELLGASIKQLGIVGLAGKTIDKLFDAGYTNLPRLLTMSEKNIRGIDGFGQAMVTSIKVALPAALAKCSTAELMDMSGVFMKPGLSLGTESLVKLEKVLGKEMKLKDPTKVTKAIGPAKGQLFVDKYPSWVKYEQTLEKYL